MRSALRCFSRFALSLIFCFAITTPKIALADWKEFHQNISYSYNTGGWPSSMTISPKYLTGARPAYQNVECTVNSYVDSDDYAIWNTVPTTDFYNITWTAVGSGRISKGTRFKITNTPEAMITYTTKSSPTVYDYTQKSFPSRGFSFWVSDDSNSNLTRVYPDGNGVIKAPFGVGYIFVMRRIELADINTSWKFWRVTLGVQYDVYYPEDFNEVEAIEQQTEDIGEQTQQQTDTLMDTSGSDGVMSSATGVQNQINRKLGFVSQSASMITGLYDSLVNVSPTNYVTFPELKFQNYVIIPETQVALLGWIPEIEQPIRMFITGVFVLAWLHGVKVIYGKIFLGETEVVTDGEE